jgi:hypothetical protein
MHFIFCAKTAVSSPKKRKFKVLAVDLICSCAVEIAVDFRERWALSAVAMV